MKTHRTIYFIALIFSFAVFENPDVYASEKCIIKSMLPHGCLITWAPTNEASRTPQAASEAFNLIIGGSCNLGYFCKYRVSGICSEDYPNNEECYGCGKLAASKSGGQTYYSFVCQQEGSYAIYHYEYGSWHFDEGRWDVYCGQDSDADGLPDNADNCPNVSNSDQADDDCDGIGNACEQTLITLSSFEAHPGFGSITIVWPTASELDNAGFNLYRAESESGEYVKINASLIPAQGSPTQGAAYEFVDRDVRLWRTYYYKLEDIDLNGVSSMHGPVPATVRLIR